MTEIESPIVWRHLKTDVTPCLSNLPSFHYYGTSSMVFPRQHFYDGASTIMILVIMMGQCMLPNRASDNDESNDYTRSDGVYRF